MFFKGKVCIPVQITMLFSLRFIQRFHKTEKQKADTIVVITSVDTLNTVNTFGEDTNGDH